MVFFGTDPNILSLKAFVRIDMHLLSMLRISMGSPDFSRHLHSD
jgi:hypothetical protein